MVMLFMMMHDNPTTCVQRMPRAGEAPAQPHALCHARLGGCLALRMIALLGLLLLPACTTQTTSTQRDPNANAVHSDRLGTGAPRDLHDICGFLLRYKAEKFALPDSLAQLRAEGYMPAEGYPGLPDYAYNKNGMGTLSNGKTVIAVDTAVRLEGHLWCVLQEPNLHPRAAALEVVLVSLEDLQQAARQRR